MNRAPGQIAPSWLPRQQRRWIDAQLRKLIRPGVCSIRGIPLKHNSRTAGGLDNKGYVVLAGECCAGQVTAVFVRGLYSDRKYDFLLSRGTEPSTDIEPTNKQIADALAAYQEVIADTDKRLDGVERRGGVARQLNVSVLDSPWKSADRAWFEQNPGCAHRMRMPFPGEFDEEAAKATAAQEVLIVLVRQVEPRTRLRARLLITNWLPLPTEAAAHALFEVAMGREAMPEDIETLDALIEKYKLEPRQ